MPDQIVKPAARGAASRTGVKERRGGLVRLLLLVTVLTVAVALAATNPTMDEYVRFVEVRLAAEIEKMDQGGSRAEQNLIKGIFRARGIQLVDSVVRPNSLRRNWGLCSLFETRVLEEQVLVLGIAEHFIPIRGVEEVTLKVGRLAF